MTVPERKYTLLDLVSTVREFAETDEEVVATVTYLVNSGKIRLCGNLAGSRIETQSPNSTQLGAA